MDLARSERRLRLPARQEDVRGVGMTLSGLGETAVRSESVNWEREADGTGRLEAASTS